MTLYLLKRFFFLVPTLLGITFLTFALVHLTPGDPASLKAQGGTEMLEQGASETIVAETRALYGLDAPLVVQYGRWLWRLVTFDFGMSYHDHRPVIKKIGEALPITLTLNFLSIFIVFLIAVPCGAAAAMRPGGILDRLSLLVFFALYSLPPFWLAIMLIVTLGGGDMLNAFPITGFVSAGATSLPWYGWLLNVAWHVTLPVLCLVAGSFAFLSRFTRSAFLEVVREDYIRVARAKGCSTWRVMIHHATRNAMIPLVTLTATLLPTLIGGSIVIEQIFALPGMGRLAFTSVLTRDYPTIMAIATIAALLTLTSILFADLVYRVVDPRITFERR